VVGDGLAFDDVLLPGDTDAEPGDCELPEVLDTEEPEVDDVLAVVLDVDVVDDAESDPAPRAVVPT